MFSLTKNRLSETTWEDAKLKYEKLASAGIQLREGGTQFKDFKV